mgnify:CR=1 FL=1
MRSHKLGVQDRCVSGKRIGLDRAFPAVELVASGTGTGQARVTRSGFHNIRAHCQREGKQVSLAYGQIAIGNKEDEGKHGTRREVTFRGARVRTFRR